MKKSYTQAAEQFKKQYKDFTKAASVKSYLGSHEINILKASSILYYPYRMVNGEVVKINKLVTKKRKLIRKLVILHLSGYIGIDVFIEGCYELPSEKTL